MRVHIIPMMKINYSFKDFLRYLGIMLIQPNIQLHTNVVTTNKNKFSNEVACFILFDDPCFDERMLILERIPNSNEYFCME